jgi:hypothetical protein
MLDTGAKERTILDRTAIMEYRGKSMLSLQPSPINSAFTLQRVY